MVRKPPRRRAIRAGLTYHDVGRAALIVLRRWRSIILSQLTISGWTRLQGGCTVDHPIATSVLIVTPWWPSDAEDPRGRFIYDSVSALSKIGVHLNVLVLRPARRGATKVASFEHNSNGKTGRSTDPHTPGVKLRVYPSVPGFRLPGPTFLLFRLFIHYYVSAEIRRLNPEVAHVHTERTAIGAYPATRRRDTPCVVTLHSNDVTPQIVDLLSRAGRLESTLYSVASIILVGSVLRQRPELPKDLNRIHVIGNGVQREKIDAIISAVAARDMGAPLAIVSASVLFEGKGLQYSLQALSDLKSAGHTQWHYLIIGTGPYESVLRSLVYELDIQSHVTFAGMRPNERVLEAMATADVFLLPSYHEAFGVAHLEAMAMGCLSIAVRGQGPSDFIEHLRTGILIDPKTAAAISQALLCIINDRQLYRDIAIRGQQYVFENYTWEEHARKLSQVYRAASSTEQS